MGEILNDGSIQGYKGYCQLCKKPIDKNIQGDEIGKHICKSKEYYINRIIESCNEYGKFVITDFEPSLFDFKSMRVRLTKNNICVFDDESGNPKTINFELTDNEYKDIFDKITCK